MHQNDSKNGQTGMNGYPPSVGPLPSQTMPPNFGYAPMATNLAQNAQLAGGAGQPSPAGEKETKIKEADEISFDSFPTAPKFRPWR